MKARILPFLAATIIAGAALADAVAPRDAVRAARGWAREGGVFRGARRNAKGTAPEATSSVAYKNKGGTNLFYAVTLEGGALVIVSGDDAIEPVLAFKEKGGANLDEGSPLRKILERDISLRMKETGATAAQTGRAGAGASAAPSRARKMWNKLFDSADAAAGAAAAGAQTGRAGAGEIGPNPNIETGVANQAESIADIRVEPFLTTAWNQEYAESETGDIALCYNYYTPGYYPCGCTATALAQIMKYWGHPDTPLPAFTSKDSRRETPAEAGGEPGGEPGEEPGGAPAAAPEISECTVDGLPAKLKSALYPEDRSYDWSIMEDAPTAETDEAARAEIGKLTYDIGIAINSDYTAEGTGANFEDAVVAVRKFFGYANAVMFYDYGLEPDSEEGLHLRMLRNRAIYANLDAKMPVLLGISNSEGMGGHAVVADGYGFVKFGYDDGEDALLDFAHINVGWGGIDNIWYNLPVVYPLNTGAKAGDTGYKFDLLEDVVFNIHPAETRAILSGRVTYNGEGLEDAEVALMQGDTVVATTNSVGHGIYSFFAEGGQTYSVRATYKTGARTYEETIDGIELAATGTTEEGGYKTDSETLVGNSWGNNIELGGSVCVGGEYFSDLADAIWYACTNELDATTVEILAPATLGRAVAVTRDITVKASPDTAEGVTADDCIVTVAANAFVKNNDGIEWAVQVAAGATLANEGVAWQAPGAAAAKPPVFELAGADAAKGLAAGRLVASGKLCLGQVAVHDAESFAVSGAVEIAGMGVGILHVGGAAEAGTAFGKYDTGTDVAAAAGSIVNIAAPDALRGATDGEGNLVWAEGGITREEDANACFTSAADGEVKYFSSFDRLLEANTEFADVTILRKVPADAWTTPVALTGALKISGKEGAEAELSFGGAQAATAFALSGGDAVLEIENMTLTRTNTAGKSFITLDGGAKLTLGAGAAVSGVAAGNAKAFACAIEVNKGTVEMLDGSSITECSSVSGAKNGTPAAVYLAGEGCVLDMQGGEITGCTVKKTGSPAGAVRANKDSKIHVSGSATVTGNTDSAGKPCNLYIWNDLLDVPDGEDATEEDKRLAEIAEKVLRVAGPLSGGAGIGVTYKGTNGCFAAVSENLSDDDLAGIAPDVKVREEEGGSGDKFVDIDYGQIGDYPFFNDADAAKVAGVSLDRKTLEWVDAPEAPDTVDADDPRAVAGVGAGTDDTEARYYADVATALEAAGNDETVFLVKDATLERNVEISGEKSLILDGCGFTLTRTLPGNNSATIALTSGAKLYASGITFDGGGVNPILSLCSYGRLFTVSGGGGLKCTSGVEIVNVICTTDADVAPVVVQEGSWMELYDGAAIRDCRNFAKRKAAGALAAAAVAVSGPSRFGLYGGTIKNCEINTPEDADAGVGAVCVANGAEAYVSGDSTVWDNYINASVLNDYIADYLVNPADEVPEVPEAAEASTPVRCNLLVHDKSTLYLKGEFNGCVGYTEGINGDVNVFGRVSTSYLEEAPTDGELEASAGNFRHDSRCDADGNPIHGIPVRNDEYGVKLVWSDALEEGQTEYIIKEEDGAGGEVDAVYTVIAGGQGEAITCGPIEVASIAKSADGANWEIVLTGGTLGCRYVLRTSDTLDVPVDEWEVADEIEVLEEFETDKGETAFAFRPEAADGERRFWYVEGFDGEK